MKKALSKIYFKDGDRVKIQLIHKSKKHDKLQTFLNSQDGKDIMKEYNSIKKEIKNNKGILFFQGQDNFIFLDNKIVADGSDYDLHSGRNGLTSFNGIHLGSWKKSTQLINNLKKNSNNKVKEIVINNSQSSILNSYLSIQ